LTTNIFINRRPAVADNPEIRKPQKEAYEKLTSSATDLSRREVGIVMPVGCGKSGCITLTPFAFRATRALVVAPSVAIASQLYSDFDPTQPQAFYLKTGALPTPPLPEPVEIRGTTSNRGDLDEADVIITNIQQLQGVENRWLLSLPQDYFDLIIFDEGHHNVAATWETLKSRFPDARIVNFSATPLRADGQKMAGDIIYSYPVFRAIQEGYVKRLKALVLNPRTLKYVRQKDGQEIEVPLEEVRRLGEEDADFRRSIVTSEETLNTIIDASIRELDRIREETKDQKHKIIAAALNYRHCQQVVAAYRARGRSADYVHSRENGAANKLVMTKLENHELDVIVQVRKLGEGFDHPYLSVAAVFSIFSNLSPFVQFVGRIMRVIVQGDALHPLNQGTVVFHAGANIARRWEDFQEFSEADQEFFQQLLPIECLDFSSSDELAVVPRSTRINTVEVRDQTDILLEEIPLIQSDPEAMRAIALLRERGFSPEQVSQAMTLTPVPTSKIRTRQAMRDKLDENVKNETGRILASRGLNSQGRDLDKRRLGRTNFVVIKSTIDRAINNSVEKGARQRHEFTRSHLDAIEVQFLRLVEAAEEELFNA